MSGTFDIFSELGLNGKSNESSSQEDFDAEETPQEPSDNEGLYIGDEEEDGDEYDGDEVADDEGEEEAEETADSGMMALIKEMREELQGLRAQLAEQKSTETKQEETLIEFVDDEMFDSAITSKEGLNKLLNTVHKAGHASAMQLLPTLVREEAQKIYEQRAVIDSFYRSNPDLANVKPVVQAVAKEVQAEFPNERDTKKVFLEIAKRARARVKGSGDGKLLSTNRKNPGSVSSGAGRHGSGKPGSKRKPTIADELQIMRRLGG